MSKKVDKIINKFSEKVLKLNLSGTTSLMAYQPEVPENAKRYLDKKPENDK